MANPRVELTIGQRFGRLAIVKRLPNSWWLCQCDCGNSKKVRYTHLSSGFVQSCGCLRLERLKAKVTTHGKREDRVYGIWMNMLQRCNNPRNPEYKNYGGRGITVCLSWSNFSNFYGDMGDPPTGTMLERENNNGPYSPENCVWADRIRQNNNKRNNRILTHNGVSKPLAYWADKLNVKYHTLHARLRSGWSVLRTLTQPVGKV